jgi:hypothetical protein
VKAFPNAFAGGWWLVWERHNGPFGLKIDQRLGHSYPAGLRLGGSHPRRGGAALCAIHDAASYPTPPDRLLKKGGHFLHASLGPPGTRGFNMKVSFTQPGVTVMTAFFNLPQPWFRVRDKLRDRA